MGMTSPQHCIGSGIDDIVHNGARCCRTLLSHVGVTHCIGLSHVVAHDVVTRANTVSPTHDSSSDARPHVGSPKSKCIGVDSNRALIMWRVFICVQHPKCWF